MSEIHSGVKFKHLRIAELEFNSIIKHTADKMISALEELPDDCIDGIAGNISARLDDGILVSSSGSCLKQLSQPDNFCKVVSTAEEMQIRYYGMNVPSSESKMHLLLYSVRSDIDFCLHVHLPNIARIQILDRYPITSKFLSYGTIDLAKEAARTIGSGDIVILRDHGILVVGKDLKSLTRRIKQLRNIQ